MSRRMPRQALASVTSRLVGAPGSVAQRLHDVFALKIRVVGKDFIDAVARADLAHDHAYCDTHAANAGLAAHDVRLLGDPIQLPHVRSLSQRIAMVVIVPCAEPAGRRDARMPRAGFSGADLEAFGQSVAHVCARRCAASTASAASSTR